jgi:hypothetical protein
MLVDPEMMRQWRWILADMAVLPILAIAVGATVTARCARL